MIVTRTPLRISFAGGGTDFPAFFEAPDDDGFVISSAINKYVTVIVSERFDDKLYVNYSKKEIVDDVGELQHDLVRLALQSAGIRNGVEITMLADIPSEGSGLGSSSALTVGLLNALYTLAGEAPNPYRLARDACRIEVGQLGRPIGYQDQWIAAFGGLKGFRFDAAGVDVSYLPLEDDRQRALSSELLLFFTGVTRRSSTVLTAQNERTELNRPLLRELREHAHTLHHRLVWGKALDLGLLLHQGWALKRQLAPEVTNPQLDELYRIGLAAGASGGKIAGAGGGGFLLLHVPLADQPPVRRALGHLQELPFDLCRYGSQVLLNTQE